MAITAGDNLNKVPSPTKATFATNYLDLASGSTDWGQQYVPDLMEKEAEVFGNRTISGFLSQVSAEEAMTADQVVWSEQGRLHLSYIGNVKSATATAAPTGVGGVIEIDTNIDGVATSTSAIDHGIRVNDMLLVASSSLTSLCLVTGVTADDIDVVPYDATASGGRLSDVGYSATDTVTVLVVGSEYGKGMSYVKDAVTTTNVHNRSLDQVGFRQSNEPQFKSYSNKPIIMKDYYAVSGSDASRVGWVEISQEDGTSGYLWYLKAESETRMRFTDQLEMAMLESIKVDNDQSEAGQSGYLWYLKAEADTRARFTDYLEMAMLESVVGSNSTVVDTTLGAAADSGNWGSQGLFNAISDRGNITTGITGVNPATDLAEFDAILAEFDNQGAIEENMMFVNRASSLAIDDMLASMNSYGAGGTSFGVFNNSEDMALNLGFSGFRRGSYDFYKSDMRYLNDKATRGGINDASTANAIRGVIVPAGTSTVYDQMMGKNIKRPFLHVRYRASETDNRRMKTWITGSVGAATSALDAMEIHFLSERCLITQGANNFMLFK